MNEEPPPAPRSIPSLRHVISFGVLLALLFGGICAFTGAVIATIFVAVGGPPWHDWALDRAGVQATAEVIQVTPTSSRINGRAVKRLTVSYRDVSSAPRTGQVSTADPAILGAASLGKVDIEFLPDRPQIVRVRGGRASFFGPFILIPVGFFAVGSLVLAVGATRLRTRRRVYRDGAPARAVVTHARPTSGRLNRRRVFRVEYQFQGPQGSETGSYTTTTPDELGRELWIIYDPADVRRNLPA